MSEAALLSPPQQDAVRPWGASKVAFHERERRRRRLVRLIFLAYWLLLFEGVLRKWVFPQYQQLLFFARDPLTIAIYFFALKDGFIPRRAVFLWLGGLFALLALPVIVVQYLVDSTQFVWILAIYGWRNYFLYLPLPFVIAACMGLKDVETLVRRTLWLIIPITVLVFLQYQSPPTSPINRGFGEGENQFSGLRFVAGKIRPLGTFTSNQGQSPFVAASVAMALMAWMTPSIRSRINFAGLVAATCSSLVMLAVSGSRTAILWSALIVIGGILAAFLSSGHRPVFPMLIVPGSMIFVAFVIVPAAFPSVVRAFMDRWAEAQSFEVQTAGQFGVFSRAANDLFQFRYLLSPDHPLGYQMGVGGNAANLMGTQTSMIHPDYQMGAALESEWGRHVADIGVLGVLFIIYRICFVGWLFVQTAGSTLRTGNAHPLLLFSFSGLLLFNGQVTGQGAQNGFAWLFVGFALAVCTVSSQSMNAPFDLGQRQCT